LTAGHVDTVVVGSGFGGAVTACRLAAAGRSVCVLERGRRWTAPDFPRSIGAVADAFWDEQRSYGFLEYLAFRRFDVIQGAGVGGGSLHYFNVNLPAPTSVFENPAWPMALRQADLEPFYDAATTMLGSSPIAPPAGRALPLRTTAFTTAARRAGYEPERVPIAVHTGPATDVLPGMSRQPCTYCGNCLFGCNDGAKNTLDRNYLALAERDGCDVRPLHRVDRITPIDDGAARYEVGFTVLPDVPGATVSHGTVRARDVVVAAGALGSSELLLRCRDETKTLPGLGAALGSRFSLNGELLFAFTDRLADRADPGIGPPITARVTRTSGDTTVTIEDLGLPDSLMWFLEGAVPPRFHRLRRVAALVSAYLGRAHGRGVPSVRLDAVLSGDRTTRAMPYLGMGNDSSDGTMRLDRGQLDVSWSPRRNRAMYRLMEDTLADLSASAGGRYTPSFLGRWPLRRSLTAHPLGGCPMGDDPTTSVVDDLGRVHGHPGLFVIDGSIIPTALAVNPSLTIAAIAERSVAAMIAPDATA
jgi:cholesterol oxidase